MIKVIKMFNLYGIMRVLKNPELYHKRYDHYSQS